MHLLKRLCFVLRLINNCALVFRYALQLSRCKQGGVVLFKKSMIYTLSEKKNENCITNTYLDTNTQAVVQDIVIYVMPVDGLC